MTIERDRGGIRGQRLGTLAVKGLLRWSAPRPDAWRSLCGGWLGLLIMAIAPQTRRVVDINLKIAFPDGSAAQRLRLRRRNFGSWGAPRWNWGRSGCGPYRKRWPWCGTHTRTCQHLCFHYGVHAVEMPSPGQDWEQAVRRWLVIHGIEKGVILLTQGPSRGHPGDSNRLEILRLEPSAIH